MRHHPQFTAYAALVAVCFFWGTTYLGIRMSLESFQPMTLVALRYILSGGILLAAVKLKGVALPTGRELWRTVLWGVIVLGGGNGALTIAETWIPSGLAALMITISPFWLVAFDAMLPGGEPLHGPTLGGMLVGLLGTALLLAPGARPSGELSSLFAGFLVLQAGCVCWTFGSLMQRREKTTAHPIVLGAIQQLATGIAFVIPAALTWKTPVWHSRSSWAVVYLVIFGSIVGYSAFIFVMDRLPVALVSIYNYINPVVAVFLGWLFYREPFGRREALAMVVIFLGVFLVKKFSVSRRS